VMDKKIARDLIIKNHYTHKWSSCRYAMGIYPRLSGVAIFGHPVGRRVASSISSRVHDYEVLELTRFWCDDSELKNTESWFISKCLMWIKKNTPTKVIIAYSDPMQGHIGTIYQASNFLYQGNKTMLIQGYKHFVNGEWLHPRTCVARYGTINAEHLLSIDSNYRREYQEHKHRYLYILRCFDEITNSLKHPVIPYVKKYSDRAKEMVADG
jgi:hypothetical protein